MYIKEGIRDFDLDHIFDCGQCFRWTKEQDGSYTGIAFGKVVNIDYEKTNGTLMIDNAEDMDFESIWKNYLDLDRDYSAIKRELARKDKLIGKAITYGEGIRILNQEKWETLVSFIISQNNNIPRIKKCIEILCEDLGECVGEYKGKKYYDMPKPEVLAMLTEADLDRCRLGYRAKYIIETAKSVTENVQALEKNHQKPTKEAFEYLISLCGVGPKVANCILLFSMGKYESFPIDVWVRRIMKQLYGIDERNIKEMVRYAEEKFGQYGGIAQQYLFYYVRNMEVK